MEPRRGLTKISTKLRDDERKKDGGDDELR